MASSSSPENNDRIEQLMAYLNDTTLDTLPEHLRFQYTDGWDPNKLDEQLQEHPFFMTELPDPTKPLPPLLEAFQQLKYSETENSSHELALNHKEDGIFHFKIKKYRIAATCFSTALAFEYKSDEVDKELLAQLFNNRSACMWFIGNYRSCLADCIKALEHNSSYFKAVRRALGCLEHMEKWSEIMEWCEKWEEDFKEDGQIKVFCQARKKATLGQKKSSVKKRQQLREEVEMDKKREKIMKIIKSRGYKLRNENFMDCPTAQDGRVVTIDAEGELHWPVVFMYPQYSLTDLIEAFYVKEKFITHIREVLDSNRPSWDRDNEYKCDRVEIYYIGLNLEFIKVNFEDTLHDVLIQPHYRIPYTGVPSFFILSKDNEFCKLFKGRVDVEGVDTEFEF